MIARGLRSGYCALMALFPVAPIQAQVGPCAVVAAQDGQTLYVAWAGTAGVEVLSLADRAPVRTIPVSGPPSGLALAPDGTRLYVTCPGPTSVVEKGVRDDY